MNRSGPESLVRDSPDAVARNARPRRRIVIISPTYPPVIGGAEIDAQRLGGELIRRGHEVKVLCMGGPPMPGRGKWTDEAGVAVRILTGSRNSAFSNILFALRVAVELWKERRSCEIAFFSMFGMYVATGLLMARVLGQRIILKVHGSAIIPAVRRSRLGSLELKGLGKWASKVIVLNQGMVEEALAAGLPAGRLRHLPNPIDTERFEPVSGAEKRRLREIYGLPGDAKILAYTGRLAAEKGLSCLLKAFGAAAREIPDAMLVLVGDGPERERLEAEGRRQGLEPGRIHFAGRVPPAEVPRWLALADAFALLSPNEGFSCALAEAMASELPPIVTAIPANVQLVEHDVNGLIVPVGDSAATALAIRNLLSDSAARQRMGAAARSKIVRNYSLGLIVNEYENLFEEALAQTP